MSNEIHQDDFFSEMSYTAANDLAGVIGPIFEALFRKTEPNWQAVSAEIAHRQMASIIYGSDVPAPAEARLLPFKLMSPLVKAKDKDPMSWVRYLDEVCDVFPAYYAAIVREEKPTYSKDEVEAAALLRYAGKRTSA
jgi:hypothetical protein